MALSPTQRRYYWRAAINKLLEGENDLALILVAKRNEITPAPFGRAPYSKKLAAVVSREFQEEIQETINPYVGLDDLVGIDEQELLEAGLTIDEAAKLLRYMEAL
jgi:hypothetical protein